MQATYRPIVIGHRGASGYRPEHTLAAHKQALRLGADAIEADVVLTRDGILAVRHENELSETTDIAEHPEFKKRRVTKIVDGTTKTGWFTEDFDWAELSTLFARERRPNIRPSNATYESLPLLKLADLIALVKRESFCRGRPVGLVVELKHVTYFESIGLPVLDRYCRELATAPWLAPTQLITESFELTILSKLRDRGMGGTLVYLIEAAGAPFDRIHVQGAKAADYASDLTDVGLEQLSNLVDGISVDKSILLSESGHTRARLVARAHAKALSVFTWTLRPENPYLSAEFALDTTGFGDWRGEFASILRTRVDGVFADYPDLALEVRKQLFGTAS